MIDAQYNPYNCSDCRNYWLIKYPKLLAQIFYMKCSNGNDFLNNNNFQNCNKSKDTIISSTTVSSTTLSETIPQNDTTISRNLEINEINNFGSKLNQTKRIEHKLELIMRTNTKYHIKDGHLMDNSKLNQNSIRFRP